MVSTQNKQMAQFFASMTERISRPDLDLATIRDVCENLHLAAKKPEGVCYADVDIGGVPALWCVPTDCDMNRVLLHAHRQGCWRACTRAGLPAFARTQVPGSNRGHGKGIPLAPRERDSC